MVSLFDGFNIELVKNNSDNRESEYFIQSLKQLSESDDSITFYAHNKGGTSDNYHNDTIKHWLYSMYFFNLDSKYLSNITLNLSTDKVFSGILRKDVNCSPWVTSDWHYSGTFFWFNTKYVLNNPKLNNFKRGRYSVEAFPGEIASLSQSYCTFYNDSCNYDTYLIDNWNIWISKNFLGDSEYDSYMKLYNEIFKKNMISVIIPTLWKCDRLYKTLEELNSHELVGEILLFDNTSNTKKIENLQKVNHILEGKNTYVTAPWNKGAAISKYDKLLILNDDNWMDWSIINILYEYITPDIGIIGMAGDAIDLNENGELKLVPVSHRHGNFGIAMFIHKNNWIPIPSEMKVWCQDDWLFVKNRDRGKQNYSLTNFKIHGLISMTNNFLNDNIEIQKIRENDLKLKDYYNLF